MNKEALEDLLKKVRDGATTISEALERLKSLPFEDMGFATLDHHRTLRCGFPEVIFCQDKRTDDILRIAEKLYEQSGRLLATRVGDEAAKALLENFPNAKHYERARALSVSRDEIHAAVLHETNRRRASELQFAHPGAESRCGAGLVRDPVPFLVARSADR